MLVRHSISCYDFNSYNLLNCKTMTTVSVSPKFQVVIPKEIREALHLFSGQRMEVRLNKGKVEFVPEKTILSYRGRWPGIDSTIERDSDRV
jgi:AbrB family looped-hinge helix DNA binding protein